MGGALDAPRIAARRIDLDRLEALAEFATRVAKRATSGWMPGVSCRMTTPGPLPRR